MKLRYKRKCQKMISCNEKKKRKKMKLFYLYRKNPCLGIKRKYNNSNKQHKFCTKGKKTHTRNNP